MNKLKKLYFMGNAHLDPVWMWRWTEGSAEAKATIRSALDRMYEYEDFIFVCSASQVFEWIEEFDSEMFEEIKVRVKEGRFVIVGGWFIQPDCNLPSGESFVRQGLYAQRYFKEKFGVTARIGYNVDSFGHNGNLPQFLKKSGMDYYVAHRPGVNEMDMPSHVFRWRSKDGSEVLFGRLLRVYNSSNNRMANNEKFQEQLDIMENAAGTDYPAAIFPYGVGNHGGGPTRQNIDIIHESITLRPQYAHIMSNGQDFFDELETYRDQLAVVETDLQHHASGCYSTVSAVKTGIRKAEWDMFAAENFSMMAKVLLNKRIPAPAEFAEAWKNILFAHFHDSMGGCCIKAAHDDTVMFLHMTQGMAQKAVNNALQTLSWKVDTSDASKGVPLMLFNPHAFAVQTVVSVGKSMYGLYDSQGNPVPTQKVHAPRNLCSSNLNAEIWNTAFVAKLPAMGYATYYFRGELKEESFSLYHSANPAALPRTDPTETDIRVDGLTMENENLRVTFDAHNGTVASLFHKGKEKELLCRPGNLGVVIDEYGHDTWSHAKNFFDKEIALFGDARVEVLETGPVRATIKVTTRYNRSVLTQYFSLTSGGNALDVRGRIDWHEAQKMLKLRYPTSYNQNPQAFYEIPYGVIERPANGEEEPGQTWIAVKDGADGLALLNDNKYSFSIKGGELNLTVCRSPYYNDHGRGIIGDPEIPFTDQGEQEFHYSLLPVSGQSWAEVSKAARVLNFQPVIIPENNHKGILSDSLCGMTVSADNVMVGAWKQSEDGKGMILRAYELDGKETPVTIDGPLMPVPLKTTFKPYSIQTYFLENGADVWKEVMLTEYDY